MILAALAASCGKDNDSRLRLIAENLGANGGAKVFVDPTTPNGANWNNGETIDLNGSRYSISREGSNYYLNVAERPTGQLYALYPATLTSGGNDIVVSNNLANGCAVAIHKLTLDIHDGGHDVILPMAARVGAEGNTLLFKHLTGCIKLTISNTTGSAITVDTIKVGALDVSDNPVIYKNLTPNGLDWGGGLTWTTATLPAIPGGEVGETDGNVSALYTGEITLVMKSGPTNHATIAAGGSLTLCVPMLADDVKTFTVKGYSGSSVIFDKSATLDTPKDIERNKLFTIPTIEIN